MRMYLGSINDQVWEVTENDYAIIKPEDPTTQVMVHFGYESIAKIHRLEDQLKAQQKTIKRHQQVIDE